MHLIIGYQMSPLRRPPTEDKKQVFCHTPKKQTNKQTIESNRWPNSSKIAQHIQQQYDEGSYRHISHPDSLARQLTRDLRAISQDLHLSVWHTKGNETAAETTAPDNQYTGLHSIRIYGRTL